MGLAIPIQGTGFTALPLARLSGGLALANPGGLGGGSTGD